MLCSNKESPTTNVNLRTTKKVTNKQAKIEEAKRVI